MFRGSFHFPSDLGDKVTAGTEHLGGAVTTEGERRCKVVAEEGERKPGAVSDRLRSEVAGTPRHCAGRYTCHI